MIRLLPAKTAGLVGANTDISESELECFFSDGSSSLESSGSSRTSVIIHKCLLTDCEFIQMMDNTNGLGRVSIVGFYGDILLDEYSWPSSPYKSLQTQWSGITWRHIQTAKPFAVVQEHVKETIKDKWVIGHALHNDFKVLELDISSYKRMDTQDFRELKVMAGITQVQPVGLKRLAKAILNLDIQDGSHCSVEDAKATMELFKCL